MHPRQARQLLRIPRIVLAPAAAHALQPARIRHNHRVPQLAQHLAHPVAMRPRLQRDPPGRYLAELLFQRLLRAGHTSPLDDLSRAVQDAEMAVLISHVDPDSDPHLLLAGAPASLFVGFLAMLFHGRFLSALRVRSLGSLTASRMEPAFSFHLGGEAFIEHGMTQLPELRTGVCYSET